MSYSELALYEQVGLVICAVLTGVICLALFFLLLGIGDY